MCQPASFIVTRHKIFWSKKTESHHEIITEFGLKEKNVRDEFTLVPIEIIPPNQDYKLPLKKWEFKVDFAGYQETYRNGGMLKMQRSGFGQN